MSASPDTEPLLVTYTLFPDLDPKTKTERADVEWSELIGRVKDSPTYTDKSACPLISMCEYGELLSPIGGILRHADNVKRVYGCEFDYDDKEVSPQRAAQLLQAAGILALIHTTGTHRPGAPKWHALLPFSEPCIPEKRAEYLARANRVLGGIATSESFRLSQSFYLGRVRGIEYVVLETHGRCIDLAADIEPLYHKSSTANGEGERDETTDEELRACFTRGEGRYRAMLSLSSRWAARGMIVEDIEANLHALLDTCPNGTRNADGIDLRTFAHEHAETAVRKWGESRKPPPPPPPPGAWQPPAVTTYGAAFNAAAIPLRQWVIGWRRSRGELTVDAGPPGVNKSMLMLTDAVAIVTGRQILADRVHQTGGVLFLVGEDARRDFESRLAGILAHYRIPAAELAERLHVVYLAEVDSVAYTLAEMIADMAVLNTRMLTWLREYPDVLAVFVDPLAAWHRLIENSNEALQLLCASMRALAVQGNRHVGIDHHIVKASMFDPEAHVGNLAAIRGAGAIGAAIRWAFTLARLTPETALAYGVPEEERKRYRRLDSLKASYGPDDEQTRLLRVESVPIANGETTGVLVEVDMERTRADAQERKATETEERTAKLAEALTTMLREKRPRTLRDAATWLFVHHPELFPGKKHGETQSEFTIRQRLSAIIGIGMQTTRSGHHDRIVMREPTARGKGAEIDFEQKDLPT
ncbi:MAG: AAA family ATPase [Steroidobacteraceae bacterium]